MPDTETWPTDLAVQESEHTRYAHFQRNIYINIWFMLWNIFLHTNIVFVCVLMWPTYMDPHAKA